MQSGMCLKLDRGTRHFNLELLCDIPNGISSLCAHENFSILRLCTRMLQCMCFSKIMTANEKVP